MADALRVTALGGLGEVGMNATLFECGGTRLLVDCGVTFPQGPDGADIAHADFSALGAGPDALDAIWLTHGHEDHVGALPYVLERCPAPVYGPRYALAVARERLEERGRLRGAELVPISPGERHHVGCFDLEPVRVSHSIPDATALALRTPVGLVVHSGDFKVDLAPTDGEPFDEARFRALGDDGVDLLLSDSTNIDREGHTRGEAEVAERLAHHVSEAPQRAVVALFGSNVHRLRALVEAARHSERRLCLLGRSLRMHARLGRELGLLDGLGEVELPEREAATHPRRGLLVAVTGTQGEPRAALPRLARGDHRALALEAGDTVIMSSRVIPGAELAVHATLDDLERMGLTVVTRREDPLIHCSGHAARDEQTKLLELLRPRHFVPVHGTYHHLRRHAELARGLGVEQARVFENGQRFELSKDGVRALDEVPVGRVYRQRGDVVADDVRKTRGLLSELGIAVGAVLLGPSGEVAQEASVEQRGFLPDGDDSDELLARAARALTRELRSGGPCADRRECQERGRRALRRFFKKSMGHSPLIRIAVVERGS